MSALSHLSGTRGRGRSRAPNTTQSRSQHLSVPSRGVAPQPRVSVPVTPTWGPKNNGSSKRELPKYHTPANVEYISSEEEDEVDEEVLNKLLSSYGEDKENVKSQLADLYSSSSNSCLVCISTVRHAEPVWNCPTCCDSFHLVCIQKWARDGIKAPTVLSAELFPDRDIPWYCPKCRQEFSKKQIPNRYHCYCQKTTDPKYDPWIAPHSCGAVCGRQIHPPCGHSCLLLCHPGRCPPCPKQVSATCFCGRRKNVARRCGQARWSCQDKCSKPLQCGEHNCEKLCHEGECAPCDKESLQSCRCGKETSLRACLQFDWQCGRVCSGQLPCTHHKCMEVCHTPGNCKPCPSSLRRTCPCGKTPIPANYPCVEEAPVCESSCDKPLPCGAHTCFKLCHLGDCDVCLQVRDKSCRCGRTHKTVPCRNELTCEMRCNKEKDCGRHSCRRKCCTGDCGQCDKSCERTLPCRNHKCVNECHPGRCYPCPGRVEVTCACSVTRVVVACGRERNTRPPRCKKSCKNASLCHHETQLPHRCHFEECPPCKQVCGAGLPSCAHPCSVPCHDRVLVQSIGPGDPTIVRKPCPPCTVPEQLSCHGGHEIATVPCSELKPFSCLRGCERELQCGNHSCAKECHPLEEGCGVCEGMCARQRTCAHPCTRACHPEACPPCRQYLRLSCHCGILHVSVKCVEFAAGKDLGTLLSCGSSCSKLLKCGHTCRKTCHLGGCSPQKECKKKVTLHCPCRRVKSDHKCGEVFGKEKEKSPSCTDQCGAEENTEAVEETNKASINETGVPERGSKRRWRGREKTEELAPSFLSRHSTKIVSLLALCVGVAGIYFCTLEV